MTPRAQLRALREELRHHQMRNRLAAADLRAGRAKARRVGAAMRAAAQCRGRVPRPRKDHRP